MHKHKYYKPPKPSTLPQKPIDLQARPQFITDFSDPDKYKLSESEMIQKKAALQSKNRQAARQSLQERQRKLEMGIVDEDTRKIYQTALTSKRIDLNPSIRRNLSQMIQYQRQRSANKNSRGSASKNRKENNGGQNSEEQQSEGFQGQIKKTQHFIKKLEKAKKQQNIGRAVDILLNDKKSPNFGPTKYTDSLQNENSKSQIIGKSTSESGLNKMNSSRASGMSQQETLSNIEDTIKFMEQKLFNPNWKKNQSQKTQMNSMKNNEEHKQTKPEQKMEDVKCSTISDISYNEFLSSFPSARQSPQTHIPQFASPISNSQTRQQGQQQSFDMEAQLAALRLNFNMNNNINLPIGRSTKSNQLIGNLHNSSEEEEQEDECLSTIRRMKNMMQSKAELYDNNQCRKEKENKNFISNYQSQRSHQTFKSEGDAEVDFSLTLNEDEIQLHNNNASYHKKQKPTPQVQVNKVNRQESHLKKTYEELKKSLFEEIDQLEKRTLRSSFQEEEEEEQQQQQRPYNAPVQYQYQKQAPKIAQTNGFNFSKMKNIHYEQQQPVWEQGYQRNVGIGKQGESLNKAPQLRVGTVSKELEQLKSLVHGAKQNVSNINVQKIGIDQGLGSGMRGFDYRGSINIKKHIVQH